MKTTVTVDGLRELDASLQALADEYGKAAGRGVLRRVGAKALTPMAEVARSLAPDDPDTQGNDLKASIVVGKPLNKRQRAIANKDEGKAFVSVYMGPTVQQGLLQEFGTVHHPPQPFLRPAFAQEARGAIDIVAKELGPEIEKTAARLAKRRAAKAAKA